MYELQIHEIIKIIHTLICKQCSTVHCLSNQCFPNIICKQCGIFHSLSSQCPKSHNKQIYCEV